MYKWRRSISPRLSGDVPCGQLFGDVPCGQAIGDLIDQVVFKQHCDLLYVSFSGGTFTMNK